MNKAQLKTTLENLSVRLEDQLDFVNDKVQRNLIASCLLLNPISKEEYTVMSSLPKEKRYSYVMKLINNIARDMSKDNFNMSNLYDMFHIVTNSYKDNRKRIADLDNSSISFNRNIENMNFPNKVKKATNILLESIIDNSPPIDLNKCELYFNV